MVFVSWGATAQELQGYVARIGDLMACAWWYGYGIAARHAAHIVLDLHQPFANE